MNKTLNDTQAKEFSRFLFDIAKGLILGGIGFSIIAPPETKIVFVVASMFVAYWCVVRALSLLKNV